MSSFIFGLQLESQEGREFRLSRESTLPRYSLLVCGWIKKKLDPTALRRVFSATKEEASDFLSGWLWIFLCSANLVDGGSPPPP